ncbi:peptidase PmbA [Anaplasma phagocytophilum]|uniref:Peptidase PmbA n=1 Tax=Anaplasma phagocytophilum TaxID=948 RepID=A0AA45ZHP0_ANAPH|nr:TldD/PmbA family protein [Anaplasma phagocytophilum]SBO14441.1 peptidase PmbA [Anaplasma phagocytophilum]
MSALNIAEDIIKLIKSRGVEGEVVLTQHETTSVTQRMMRLEEMIASSGCNVGIRVIVGKKYSCISSNDLERSEELVDAAIKMADLSPEDPFISVSEQQGTYTNTASDLMIFDDSIVEMDSIRDILQEMEGEALSVDSRIVNSEGASFSKSLTETALMTTRGFCGSYKKTYFSSSISVVAASDDKKMEVDYSFAVKSKFSDLEKPRVLGREAAHRALRKLNARELQTCKMPVLFENRVASSLLSNFASAINGASIADKTSFLLNDLGTNVFGSDIYIVDDPLMVSGISSRPFDGEGILSTKRNIVERGVLKSWILDMRTAKQLALSTTGHAVRKDNASVSPGVSNFYIQRSDITVQELMSDIKRGLYITDLFGFGINFATGDYSQGAFGYMIENGDITYPVHGITIAGNLRDMFSSAQVANDLIFLRSVNSPTLRFGDMVVSGA